ncbi:PstS family phosphate ABC transporter substrate-binding protein [Planococcus sp. YIM B11945]|uniref:PstS family phosphate ABC transporter substrate-binding protein n=1 Tax=Planococcus sp. YIM B11945 TaxID=3435410 RepID=UPI003D7D6C40
MRDFVEVFGVFSVIAAIMLFPFFAFLFVLNNDALQLAGFGIALEASFIVLALYLFNGKRHGKITAGLIMLFLAVGISFAVPYYYKESLKVEDSEMMLYDYEPFTGSGKLARLEKPASFKIEEEWPKLDGATALYPLYAAFAEAVYPKNSYPPYDSSVQSSSTPEAYERLIAGEADLIFAAGPSISQERAAKEAGVELKLTPIGREAFVFFVNSRNPIDSLKGEDIRGIYAGTIDNWKEVGGSDDKIRAFQRPEESGSQTTFIKFMGDAPIEEPETEDVASAMGGIINEVASYHNYKNAIGYTFRFYSTEMVRNDKIKLLGIDGVIPTRETIRSGSYPSVSEFYAVTAGTENPNVEPFLDWILSEEGQKLIDETGFVSLQ